MDEEWHLIISTCVVTEQYKIVNVFCRNLICFRVCSLILQLNDVEKKLFETEERADLAEVKVGSRKEGRRGKGGQFDC